VKICGNLDLALGQEDKPRKQFTMACHS